MALRPLLIAGFALLAVVIAFTGWAWVQIPDTALIATHWDLNDHVNGHMHKIPGLLIGPAIMVALLIFFWAITKIEPRRNNLTRSRTFFAVGFAGGLAIAALAQIHVVLTALGISTPVLQTVLPAVATLVIVMGNFMGKTRSNFFVGVRTPWTLESDHSWEKTNRWAGRFFIFSGVATLVALIVSTKAVAVGILVGALVASALVSVVLSYVFWKQDPSCHAHDSVPE
ncbi:MAG TPA: SdpI family protein [Rhizomicrobium sp.]|nr:SdpI family protein [Rhizomicrobium sp.]